MNLNLAEVAKLQPDYLGFIFYDKSPRAFKEQEIPDLGLTQKVGVFVNASLEFVLEKIEKYQLDVVQLHGEETPEYCMKLHLAQANTIENALSEEEVHALSEVEVWKVFSIKDAFDFSQLKAYEPHVDKFLFDTKGKEKGGNGYTFDWEVLKNYDSQKPFILSGGIGLEEVEKVKTILKTDLPIHALDVNSKFEDKPGLKNIEKLEEFIAQLR